MVEWRWGLRGGEGSIQVAEDSYVCIYGGGKIDVGQGSYLRQYLPKPQGLKAILLIVRTRSVRFIALEILESFSGCTYLGLVYLT